jgi:hypothetical protein
MLTILDKYTGDSRSDQKTFEAPLKMLQSLQKWLWYAFGRRFREAGNCMAHGRQLDWHSCGIIAPNTIAHAVMGTPLWEQRHYILERIRWFVRLASNKKRMDEHQMAVKLVGRTIIEGLDYNTNVLLAIGDHNFPDLEEFVLETDGQSVEEDVTMETGSVQSRISIVDLLNPTNDTDDVDISAYNENGMTESDGMSLISQGHMSGYSDVWDGQSSIDGSNVGTRSEHLLQGGAMDIERGPKDISNTCVCDNPPTTSDGEAMAVDGGSSAGGPASLLDFLQPSKQKDSTSHSEKSSPKLLQPMKRRRPQIESDSSEHSDSSGYTRRHGRVAKGEGTSRSGKAALAIREKLRSGDLEINEKSYKKWKTKLLADDPNVEFHPTNIRSARHSKCGKDILMKDPYDATRWRDHVRKCNTIWESKKSASAKTPSLMTMGWATSTSRRVMKSEAKKVEKTCPCPGITKEDDARVEGYLKRTGVLGGGARSVKAIAMEKFNKLFSKLGKKRKKVVLNTQRHEQRWRNDHAELRAFAVVCKKTVTDQAPRRPLPCEDCAAVLKSKAFKTALQKPTPDEKNYIFTNHRFRSPLLGEIYARTVGLKDLIETSVSFWV